MTNATIENNTEKKSVTSGGDMKLVIAIFRPEKLPDVKKALFDADIFRMTATNVVGAGQQRGFTENYRGAIEEVNLLKKVRIEIAVNPDHLQPCIDAIVKGARTGNIGDGKIFIQNLEQCVRIRTGEAGKVAIG